MSNDGKLDFTLTSDSVALTGTAKTPAELRAFIDRLGAILEVFEKVSSEGIAQHEV